MRLETDRENRPEANFHLSIKNGRGRPQCKDFEHLISMEYDLQSGQATSFRHAAKLQLTNIENSQSDEATIRRLCRKFKKEHKHIQQIVKNQNIVRLSIKKYSEHNIGAKIKFASSIALNSAVFRKATSVSYVIEEARRSTNMRTVPTLLSADWRQMSKVLDRTSASEAALISLNCQGLAAITNDAANSLISRLRSKHEQNEELFAIAGSASINLAIGNQTDQVSYANKKYVKGMQSIHRGNAQFVSMMAREFKGIDIATLAIGALNKNQPMI